MPTVSVNLDTTQYVRINTAFNPMVLQAHNDSVRITLSESKPAKSNDVFHVLGGDDAPFHLNSIDTNVWALATTTKSSLVVSETEPFPVNPDLEKTAFGELSIAELSPTIQIQFPFNINTAILHDHSNNGSVIVENSMAKASTGVGANRSGALSTIENIQYHPGQGTLNRFTALFTTGIVGSTQEVGIGDVADGFFFGFNESSFGALHRSGGVVEVRTLTVTVGSSTAENITITLDGNAKADITVTASGSASVTANEIATADYSQVGAGWIAHSDGDGTVRFLSFSASPQLGIYSLSSSTTATGTFVQTLAGVSPVNTWHPQTSWNRDKADGSKILPVIDFTKGNVFEIRYQWLGFGPAYFYIENPSDGSYVLVHVIEYANANTVPSISNPTLPLSFCAKNTTNTSDIVLHVGSMAAFVEGKVSNTLFHRGTDVNYSAIGTTETPILSIHNRQIFQGKINRISIKLVLFVANAESSNNKASTIRIHKKHDLVGANWIEIEQNVSVVEKDVSAISITTGDTQIAFGMSKSDSTGSVDLETKDYILHPGEIFTVTGQATSGTIEGTVSVNWEELH